MGNEATKLEEATPEAEAKRAEEAPKMEIQISGDRPFKPGDRIDGEVVITTAKPLDDVYEIEVRFEGDSETWNAEPGDRNEREVYVDKVINLPVDGGQLKLSGQHHFAFSFDVPEGCKSSVIFSRFGGTKYSITASLQRKSVNQSRTIRHMVVWCWLTILAPPTQPADDGNNNGAADDDDNNQGFSRPRPSKSEAKSISVERSLRLRQYPDKFAKMKLQLPNRVINPGEFIPISGTIHLGTNRFGPFKIKASLGFSVGRTIPTSPVVFVDPRSQRTKTVARKGEDENQAAPEVDHTEIIKGPQTITWSDEKFFRLPSIIPTESSLFHRFRNRRYLVIAMEQCYTRRGKPKRLEVKLPIQIGN